MSKKKRVFDIAFEEEHPTVPAGTVDEAVDARRGPMASAISENAAALRSRQSAETAIRTENDALAHEHVRLKKAGLITDLIPLDAIRAEKLTRDRKAGPDDGIEELKTSIRDIGLSNPIRVERAEQGYELVQGFRRLTAYRELHEETKGEAFAKIPAAINASGDDLVQLYRRMVDENLVRRGVSFAEMAQLALAYSSEDPKMESHDRAVEVLFASSNRQKRSYIKSFARLLGRTGGSLKYAELIPRALGLSVLKRIEDDPERIGILQNRLSANPDRSGEEELDILQKFIAEKPPSAPKGESRKTAKTTFRMTRPEGTAKCTAADGRIELRLARDFSSLERKRIEAAVCVFFDKLDE